MGSANVLDVETHDSVVTLRRDGEVSRGLNAFIQSWNRSLNILIAPHYAGSAESRRAYRIESPALQQAEGRLAYSVSPPTVVYTQGPAGVWRRGPD